MTATGRAARLAHPFSRIVPIISASTYRSIFRILQIRLSRIFFDRLVRVDASARVRAGRFYGGVLQRFLSARMNLKSGCITLPLASGSSGRRAISDSLQRTFKQGMLVQAVVASLSVGPAFVS